MSYLEKKFLNICQKRFKITWQFLNLFLRETIELLPSTKSIVPILLKTRESQNLIKVRWDLKCLFYLTIFPVAGIFAFQPPWIGVLLDECNCLSLIWGACSCGRPVHLHPEAAGLKEWTYN